MTTDHTRVTAAVLIIGDEILSGRTQDTNLRDIARYLAVHGVDLAATGLSGFGRPEGYMERQLARWQELPGLGDFSMAVNVSGRQAADHALTGRALAAVHAAGVVIGAGLGHLIAASIVWLRDRELLAPRGDVRVESAPLLDEWVAP